MSRYVAAIDQGTSSSRCLLFDRDGAVAGAAQREHAQLHPRAGWVEHDPLEIVANVRAVIDEAVAAAGASARRRGGRRDHEPARDDRAVGPRERRAGPQRDRVAGHAHRGARGGAGGRRRSDRLRDDHRTPPLDLLLRPEGALAARRAARRCGRARRPASCCSGRSTRWLIWQLTGGAGWRRARDRRDERQPHAADGPATLDWSRGGAGADRDPARDAARDPLLLGGLRRAARGTRARRACRSPACSATSRPRCSDRPASTPARRRTPTGPAASCSSTPARSRSPRASCSTTVAYQLGDDPRRVRAGGLDRGRRRGRAVAARPARLHRQRRRGRGARRERARHRRRLRRAGLLRPVRAALARGRARRDRRHHRLHDEGAHRARDAGGDRVADARGARRGARRRRGSRATS